MKIKIELSKTEVNKIANLAADLVKTSYDVIDCDDEKFKKQEMQDAKKSVKKVFSNNKIVSKHLNITTTENSVSIETTAKLGGRIIDVIGFISISFFDYLKGVVDKLRDIFKTFGLNKLTKVTRNITNKDDEVE